MMKKRKWPVYLLLVLCAVVTVGPFLWMILTSFKSYEESIQIPPTIFPEVFTMGSYQEVVDKFPFLNFYVNTFLVLLFTIGIELLICSMAAYAFARLHFPGRDVIFIVLLALLMVPGQIFLVPNYDIMVKLHLADTVTALWLPKVFSAFGTFMLREFFKGLPRSLDEAAMLDGCGFFQIYYRILLPLLKPALSSLAILTAISTFKDLMWPLIVNNSMDKMTLSAGLADTVTALWLPKVFSAFGTFMLREFFKGLPRSLDEAAMLDGCGFFQIYYRILLPLLKPALSSLAILTAISTFKDLMWPLIVNNSMDKMTLSAGLAMLIGEHTTYYPQVMAGGIIAILPMIIIFFLFQKQFVEGIATTGVKQ